MGDNSLWGYQCRASCTTGGVKESQSVLALILHTSMVMVFAPGTMTAENYAFMRLW